MTDLKGICALIVEGNQGIGFAIAEGLAEKGACVVITGCVESPSSQTACIRLIETDLDDSKEIERCCKYIQDVDTEGFDVFINIDETTQSSFLIEKPPESFERSLWANHLRVYPLIQAFVVRLRKDKRSGKILNISGVLSTDSTCSESASFAAQAANAGMTRALSVELGQDDILVNSLSLGFVEPQVPIECFDRVRADKFLEKIPLGRLAKLEEVVKLVTFLVGSENTYMTGQNIILDGGFVRT